MPVPDYQTLMLPLLRGLAQAHEPLPVRSFLEPIGDAFDLTEEERSERIPSGVENLLSNRLAWARTYLGKAKLLESPKRGLVRITDRGRELLAGNPDKIDNSTLRGYPEFTDWMAVAVPTKTPRTLQTEHPGQTDKRTVELSDDKATPREQIDRAVAEIDASLKSDLLDRIRGMNPSEFEGLILRLLLAMGYGQGLDEMATAVGGSGDGGIDGLIYQDPLGLDRVYIQAKRYKEGNNVSSPDIRNFIGALNINRANKGVFVTASQFTADAKTAATGSTIQVVLIDGPRLTDLMLRYRVGVLVRETVALMVLDESMFDGTA